MKVIAAELNGPSVFTAIGWNKYLLSSAAYFVILRAAAISLAAAKG